MRQGGRRPTEEGGIAGAALAERLEAILEAMASAENIKQVLWLTKEGTTQDIARNALLMHFGDVQAAAMSIMRDADWADVKKIGKGKNAGGLAGPGGAGGAASNKDGKGPGDASGARGPRGDGGMPGPRGDGGMPGPRGDGQGKAAVNERGAQNGKPAGAADGARPGSKPGAPSGPSGAGATEELRESVLRELEAMQFEAAADSAKDMAYARKREFHLAEGAAKCAFRAIKAEAQAASLMQQAAKFRLHSATLARKVVQQRALVASKEAAAAAAREHTASQPVKEAHQRKAAGIADKLAQIPPEQCFVSGGRSAKAAKAGGESDPELELWEGAFWTDIYRVATRMLAKEAREREREHEHEHERKHEAAATAHEPAQIPPDERSAASDGRTAEAASADESEHDMDEPVVWADLCEVPDSPKAALSIPEAPLAAEKSPGAPCSAASTASLTTPASRTTPASCDSPTWFASHPWPASPASSASPALSSALTSRSEPAAGATSPLANNNQYSALGSQSGSDERTDASETEAGAGGDPEAVGPAGLATPGGNEHKKGRRRLGGRSKGSR